MEGLEISRKAGFVANTGEVLQTLGDVALLQGKLEQAQAAYEEALKVHRPLGEKLALPMPLRRLGQIARRLAEYDRAIVFIHESLTLNRESKDVRGAAACLAALAAVRAAQGQVCDAIRMCGAVDAALDALHSHMLLIDQGEYEQTVSMLRKEVAASAFEAAWAEGRAMSVDQATALAIGEEVHQPNAIGL